ncbi:MAG: thioredoxin family protein [Desulfobacteraceae bacterium]|nr:thioredoxin family protein [Desulfobacteraceae bacterium]
MKTSFRLFALAGVMVLVLALFPVGVPLTAVASSALPEVPVIGKVTMVDLGAKECIPCKMMAPIMEELEKEYHASGKAAIYFIDVWNHRDQAQKFGIQSIPTQIFFDKDGKEVYRHQGFMSKKDILAKLQELGVQ